MNVLIQKFGSILCLVSVCSVFGSVQSIFAATATNSCQIKCSSYLKLNQNLTIEQEIDVAQLFTGSCIEWNSIQSIPASYLNRTPKNTVATFFAARAPPKRYK